MSTIFVAVFVGSLMAQIVVVIAKLQFAAWMQRKGEEISIADIGDNDDDNDDSDTIECFSCRAIHCRDCGSQL